MSEQVVWTRVKVIGTLLCGKRGWKHFRCEAIGLFPKQYISPQMVKFILTMTEQYDGDSKAQNLPKDDVVMLASSSQVLGQFTAKCEAARTRISTSKSEAIVLDQKKGVSPPFQKNCHTQLDFASFCIIVLVRS